MENSANPHRMLEPVLLKGVDWDKEGRTPKPIKAPARARKPIPDMAAYALRINEAFDAASNALASAEQALATGFTRCIKAGEIMIEAKLLVGHGRWLPWLQANTHVSISHAQLCMKLARAQDRIRANAVDIVHLTISQALKLMAGPNPKPKLPKLKEDPEIKLTRYRLEERIAHLESEIERLGAQAAERPLVIDHDPRTKEERLAEFSDSELHDELRRRRDVALIAPVAANCDGTPDRSVYRAAMRAMELSQRDFAKLGNVPTGTFQAYLSQSHRHLSAEQHASLMKVIETRRAA